MLKNIVERFLKFFGLFNLFKSIFNKIKFSFTKDYFLKYLSFENRYLFITTNDPVRYYTISLAISNIRKSSLNGSIAEAGVYKGETSKIIHKLMPEKKLFLFDTFEGFPHQDLEIQEDGRFKDTDIDTVKMNLGDMNNVVLRKGYIPETFKGLEDEKFSFVMIDLDLYKPTYSALEFFYPRVEKGGYIFVHDYNSPESEYAVSKAVNEYMKYKPEKVIEIPDAYGSVIIRKI